MLRNRNSFFTDNPINPQSMINQAPYPIPQNNINPMPNMNNPYNMMPSDDFDNRLAKIERQINRLDARLTKLENASKIVNDDLSSSMYMV
jgi:hypothetical protein